MYEEKQRFKWSNQLFLGITIITILPMFFSEMRDNLIAIAVIGGAVLLTGLLLYSMKQTIRIDEAGIHYKQTPLINKFKTIPWNTIQKWELTEINALKDFGGWGIRMTGSKTGYIMQGDYGLELVTDKKKKTVFSIMNRGEVEQIMKQFSVDNRQ